MVQYFDIQYGWPELFWYSTGGTRAKKYIQSPENKYYYFKRSQYKPATETKPFKDFKYEFWSEIIAYEVGTLLGFDVLRYDIAYDGSNLGCISESMFDSEKEQFLEGIKFLQSYNPQYDPNKKDHRTLYTFQAIEGALDKFLFGRFKERIVETIVFDSIIGNGDRHQENWAIIVEYSAIREALEKLEQLNTSNPSNISHEAIYDFNKIKFAPIYDSGSSLGRELTEAAVDEFLLSDEKINRYIDKGLSEIHWNEKKITHFELVKQLLRSSYRESVINIINRVVSKFDSPAVAESVEKVDIWIPEFLRQHKIPRNRKQLIIQLINLRVQKLKELLDAGI